MLVINLFGGPGSGKSTTAAYVFSQLKMAGVNAELVTEFAKDKTWENNSKALLCQPYVFGKQVYRIDRCADDVDVIVTDSPLILSIIYNKDIKIEPYFTSTVLAKFHEYNNLNFFLHRVKEYNPKGRNQTEAEAIDIDSKVKDLLTMHNIPYTLMEGNEVGARLISQMILEQIQSENI